VTGLARSTYRAPSRPRYFPVKPAAFWACASQEQMKSPSCWKTQPIDIAGNRGEFGPKFGPLFETNAPVKVIYYDTYHIISHHFEVNENNTLIQIMTSDSLPNIHGALNRISD
jgi:hypothetical protein